MSLTILNNISSLTAENALSSTQSSLQHTLTQLSTGLKINSGADDAAGLSIANGMKANMAALTQSQQNAQNGIGLLQTADGALSQVTNLLNRAVTLATEASNGGITTGANSQAAALDNEYQSIMSEINQIGQTTNFNGQNVFGSSAPNDFTSTQASLATTTALTSGKNVTIQDAATGGTFVFTAGASSTIADLQTSISDAVTAGTLSAGTQATINGSGQLEINNDGTTASDSYSVSSNDAVLGPMVAASSNNTATVYLGDGVTTGAANTQISTVIKALNTAVTGNSVSGLSGTSLSSASNAQSALTAITSAINLVSAQRGDIGASINRLSAASAVESNAVSNLQSATNNIENADIGKTVANMTQYNVLQSTGMAALQQSNQAQQAVLKLVQ